MGKKSELSSSLASSVASLAASAAKEKPKVRATPRRGSTRKPDEDQENALDRTTAQKGDKRAGSRENAPEDGAERSKAIAADQTRVLVSGLAADTQAEDLENAFRFLPFLMMSCTPALRVQLYFVFEMILSSTGDNVTIIPGCNIFGTCP